MFPFTGGHKSVADPWGHAAPGVFCPFWVGSCGAFLENWKLDLIL